MIDYQLTSNGEAERGHLLAFWHMLPQEPSLGPAFLISALNHELHAYLLKNITGVGVGCAFAC